MYYEIFLSDLSILSSSEFILYWRLFANSQICLAYYYISDLKQNTNAYVANTVFSLRENPVAIWEPEIP